MKISPTEKKNQAAVRVLLGFFVLYTFLRFGVDQIKPPGFIPGDYTNFHRAAERLIPDQRVYRPEEDSPFKYSPTFLVIFRYTFHQLPQNYAWFLWCILSTTLFGVACDRLFRASGAYALSSKRLALLLGAFLVAGWHGYIEHFSYGQGDFIVFSLFVIAATSTREWVSSLIMAGQLIMKPQSAIFLAFFGAFRRWKMLVATAALTLFLLWAPTLIWGWGPHESLLGQWMLCLQGQKTPFLTGNHNQTPAAVLARVFRNRDAVQTFLTVQLTLAVLASLFAFLKFRALKLKPTPLHIVTATLFYALSTPLSWRWFTFVWIPCGVVLATYELSSHRKISTLSKTLWGLFALQTLLRQGWFAHAIGINEVDELSYLGFYMLGNLLLFGQALRLNFKQRLVI